MPPRRITTNEHLPPIAPREGSRALRSHHRKTGHRSPDAGGCPARAPQQDDGRRVQPAAGFRQSDGGARAEYAGLDRDRGVVSERKAHPAKQTADGKRPCATQRSSPSLSPSPSSPASSSSSSWSGCTNFPARRPRARCSTIAASTRSSLLDVVEADAGSLGDLFFMKYRLEHYDVPPEFAQLRASAYRVFDDDEGHRVAQIIVPAKRLQFFIFPAERNPKDGKPREFSGWRYVEQEGWTGAVQAQAGVCFMAALRGQEKDLAPYLAREAAEPIRGGSGR